MEKEIDAIIRPSIEHMGLRLVRVKLMDSSGRRILQIMIERMGGSINVDDCANVSDTVSALLDVHDPISGEFNLEVTSPGIDRPLIDLQDFERFKGFEAKIETSIMLNGRKRWRGVLHGVVGDDVEINVDGELHKVVHARINNAKLILNDDLIKAYQDGRISH
jgi:ribosome maturation factor RimP